MNFFVWLIMVIIKFCNFNFFREDFCEEFLVPTVRDVIARESQPHCVIGGARLWLARSACEILKAYKIKSEKQDENFKMKNIREIMKKWAAEKPLLCENGQKLTFDWKLEKWPVLSFI